jgi:sec-independent protein translocase protein TatA
MLLIAHNLPLANLLGAPDNWIWIALVALLLFGRRLPEVGRSLGKGITEFKKGLQSAGDDVEEEPQQQAPRISSAPRLAERPTAALPTEYRFDPYTGQPIEPAKPTMKFDPYTGKPLSGEATGSQTSQNGI